MTKITLLLLATILSSACSYSNKNLASEVKNTQSTSILGQLTSIESLSLFWDKSLSDPVKNTSASHAVVLKDTPNYMLMLSDGNLAWTSSINTNSAINIRTRNNTISLEKNERTEKYPEWITINISESLTVLNASEKRYPATPQHIVNRGVVMNENTDVRKPFYWPQINFKVKENSGWGFFNDVYLESVNESSNMGLSGLIQKPFIPLTLWQTPTASTLEDIKYAEHGFDDVKNVVIGQHNWQTEQLVILAKPKQTNIKTIALLSAKENCNIVQVKWLDEHHHHFGFCSKDTYSPPAPLITGYKIKSNGDIALDLLYVTSHDRMVMEAIIPSRFTNDAAIMVSAKAM